MAAKTHTILIAGGSGLVGHAAIKFAIAAGHFVIALVRRGGSLSVEGLASEETLKIIEVDFDALDQYQPEISALAPNALICALGTTIRKAGSKDAFARVDRDYVAAFAALGRAAGASFTSDWCRPSAPMLDPDLSAKNCLFHSYLSLFRVPSTRSALFGAISSLAPRALSNMAAALSRRIPFPLAAYPQVSRGRSR